MKTMKTCIGYLARIALVAAVCGALHVRADYYAARNGANTHSYPFTDWATAASNIQDAVNAATNSATVWVEAGTYPAPSNPTNYVGPNVVYIDKPLILRSFSGNPEDTTIDGQGTNRGLAWYYPSASSAPFVLDGFTIANGLATPRGGGVLLDGGGWTSVVRNCIIRDNTVTNAAARDDGGGGLFTERGGLYIISNCTFRANMVSNNATSDGGGGGAYLQSNYAPGTLRGRIENCLFESNSAYNATGGGLLYNYYARHAIRNSVITRNTQWQSSGNSNHGGGGLQNMYSAHVSMWNCLVSHNRANGYGGGIYSMKAYETPDNQPLVLYNCTVVSNRSPSAGIAIRAGVNYGHIDMYNSIVRSNSVYDISYGGATTSHIYHSNLPTNNISGTAFVFDSGTITNEPAFVDFAGSDFRLAKTSPCLNAGSNQLWWMDGALDLNDNPRIDESFNTVDMGCYEYVYHGTAIVVQ